MSQPRGQGSSGSAAWNQTPPLAADGEEGGAHTLSFGEYLVGGGEGGGGDKLNADQVRVPLILKGTSFKLKTFWQLRLLHSMIVMSNSKGFVQ